MSMALKCNKCGTCFDPMEFGCLRMAIDGITIVDDISTKENRYVAKYNGIDLCPECTKRAYSWIFGEEAYDKLHDRLYGKEPEEYEDWKKDNPFKVDRTWFIDLKGGDYDGD